MNQEAGPHKLNLLASWPWTLQLPELRSKFVIYVISISSLLQYFFFFFFWFCHAACGILVPWTGTESMLPSVEAWSPNHWVTRKVPWLWYCYSSLKGQTHTQVYFYYVGYSPSIPSPIPPSFCIPVGFGQWDDWQEIRRQWETLGYWLLSSFSPDLCASQSSVHLSLLHESSSHLVLPCNTYPSWLRSPDSKGCLHFPCWLLQSSGKEFFCKSLFSWPPVYNLTFWQTPDRDTELSGDSSCLL